MSDLVPNLAELIAALPAESDGIAVAGTFGADSIEEARIALRAVVVSWEQGEVSPGATDNDSHIVPAQ